MIMQIGEAMPLLEMLSRSSVYSYMTSQSVWSPSVNPFPYNSWSIQLAGLSDRFLV